MLKFYFMILMKQSDFTTNGYLTFFRTDTGVFSSMFSYFSMSETTQQKQPTIEEQEASKQAQACIEECHLEQLITDSKFLTDVSLQELVKV